MQRPTPTPGTAGALFYFEHAAELKQYDRFAVVLSHTQVAGRTSRVWVVSGYMREAGKSELLAEFSAPRPAETFREMCAIVSRS